MKTNSELLRAMVYGTALGDALGVPFEGVHRGEVVCAGMVGYGENDQQAGTWSDDTSLTLATCDSIRELGRIDTDDIRRRFVAWLRDGAYTPDGKAFGMGRTTVLALQTGHGLSDEYDNGNGSLMRIAPLAATDASDDEIRAVSAITHAHPTSTETCVRFVHLLRRAAADPAGTHNDLQKRYGGKDPGLIASDGYVLHTYDAALWCAGTTTNFRDCALRAVSLGDDTDTTAAVAGALAAALRGYDSLPADWLEELRGVSVIESCLF